MASIRKWVTILACMLLAGCATTLVRDRWTDPSDHLGPPKKLVVFVAVRDESLRRMAEDLAARSLPPGVAAVAAHSLGIAPELDEKGLREKLAPAGFDAALIARLVSVESTEEYLPPQPVPVPDPLFIGLYPHHRSFYAYYPVA